MRPDLQGESAAYNLGAAATFNQFWAILGSHIMLVTTPGAYWGILKKEALWDCCHDTYRFRAAHLEIP